MKFTAKRSSHLFGWITFLCLLVSITVQAQTDTIGDVPESIARETVIDTQIHYLYVPLWGKDNRRKPLPPAKWQGVLSTSYGSYVSGNYGYQQLFDRGGQQDRFGENFVLPDGEIVEATYADGSYRSIDAKIRSYLLRAGLIRQSRWGGLYQLKFGYYRSRTNMGEPPATVTRTDQLLRYRTLRVDAITSELGIQFTFAKRHRFRPYVGFNLLAYLYYRGERTQYVYDERTDQTGLVEGYRSQETLSPSLDFALTAGFQFAVTDELSVGGFLYVNGATNYYLDAPFGIEARYTLVSKK